MTEKPIAAARRELDLVKTAEEVIRLALLTLEGKTGKSISRVDVDTRNFAASPRRSGLPRRSGDVARGT